MKIKLIKTIIQLAMKKLLLTSLLIISASAVFGQNSISFIGNPFVDSSPTGFFWKSYGDNGYTQRYYGDISLLGNLKGTDATGEFTAIKIGYGLEKHLTDDNKAIYFGSDIIGGFTSVSGATTDYSLGIRPFIGGEWFFSKNISLGSEIGYTAGILESPEADLRSLFIQASHRFVILTYYFD